MTTSPESPTSYAGRGRDFMRQEVKARIASVDQNMVLLQHAGHQALYAQNSDDARHWLRHAAAAAELLTGAVDNAAAAIEALRQLYPLAHADAYTVPGRPLRCACGRVAEHCPARHQLEDGFRQWVDERGRVRPVTDDGAGAILPSQR